jgi:hypothetical protein
VAYAQITYNQFVAAISARLNDPTNRFYSVAEVQQYALETLQTWQAFSAFTQERKNITTVAGQFLYNLQALIPDLAPTITDRDVIVQIQRHLQEPTSATSWIGSEQFTFPQVVQSIQRRRDRFIIETGLSQALTSLAVTAGPGNIELGNSMIDVVRATWKDLAGKFYTLFKTDQFALTGSSNTWFTGSGVPSDYTMVLATPLMIQVAPPPAANGSLELLTIDSGTDLDPANGATILNVPDDLVWVVKFGALADLFGQDGPGKDSGRQDYCESRWREGVALARLYNIIRFGYVLGSPAFIDSLAELDSFQPNWMNSANGPTQNLVASGSILGVNPPPTVGLTISLDITAKMPLPVAGGDFIQVGKEVVDALVDYAQHLAMLKEGAAELQETVEQYKNLVRMAAVVNDRLRANNNDFDALSDRSLREYHETPRRKSDISKEELDYKPDAV